MTNNFYITTAISYVNGAPHLGHAYEAILTDVMARFQRLNGKAVHFLTGTDEHGEKVAQTAEKNGVTAQAFADKNASTFKEMAGFLNLSNDDFIRTTEPRHHKAAQALWTTIFDKGEIELGHYAGWYSIREEAFFTEDELVEKDGVKYTPNDTEVEWVEEESYFFKLSKYTEKLLKLYEENPEFIQPESRRNEIISFVKGGLTDLSVSRHRKRLEWGIPVPHNDDHVMYVWLDALTNYITALGYPDVDITKDTPFWPADFHVVGKDITRFHCVYWPAFLMAAGLPLPKTVFAHGFINIDGAKMSKSIGNVLSPKDMVENYGLDAMRYLLMREIAHGQDGNFAHEHAVNLINADLANGLGNLSQRTLSMVFKNCDAEIPTLAHVTEDDIKMLDQCYTMLSKDVVEHYNGFAFHRALDSIMSIARAADVYIDQQAPWGLKKTDPERMKTVLGVLVEIIRCLAIAIQPVTPESGAKILDQTCIPLDQRSFSHISKGFVIEAGTVIEKPEGVFPRYVEPEENVA